MFFILLKARAKSMNLQILSCLQPTFAMSLPTIVSSTNTIYIYAVISVYPRSPSKGVDRTAAVPQHSSAIVCTKTRRGATSGVRSFSNFFFFKETDKNQKRIMLRNTTVVHHVVHTLSPFQPTDKKPHRPALPDDQTYIFPCRPHVFLNDPII